MIMNRCIAACIALCSLSFVISEEKYSLVICAVFQDETFYLKQWIEFHKQMGVDHFYLYNNSSSDDYLDILKPYMEQGLVDLIEWNVVTHNQKEYLALLQIPAYNHALNIVKNTAHWAAFIDLDEFLCPVRHDSMVALLEEYQECAGLAINWQTFGTSDIDRLQKDQLIVENFLWKAPYWWEINKYIKIIVQPSFVHSFSNNPHYCLFNPGFYAVNSNKAPLYDLCEVQPIVIDTVRIHHYWFGDRNWFISNKLPRRKKWGTSIPISYLDQFIDSFNQEKDETMLRFLPKRSNANYQK
jgi:hypothetical protein